MNTNRRFSLKLNFYDFIVFVLAISLVVILLVINIITNKSIQIDDKAAYVYYDSTCLVEHTVYFKDLEEGEEKEILLEKAKYPKLLDDMVIKVSKEKGIKVEEEDSPQHICSNQGWVKSVNMALYCLPNNVYVIIQDINNVDNNITLQ